MISTTSSNALSADVMPVEEMPADVITLPLDDSCRRLEAWLHDAVRDAGVHARWANTLSMLEHIGSVKIARSQAGVAITSQKLRHLAEETRHAVLLKRIATSLAPGVGDDYAEPALLAGASARGYFARLDACVRAWTRNACGVHDRGEAAYLLVTLLVELRADWLYPAYQWVLTEAGLRYSVRGIIGEETRHLADIRGGIAALGLKHADVEALVLEESRHFARLVGDLLAAAA